MATATINVDLQGTVERLDSSASTINWLTTTRDAATGTDAVTINNNRTIIGTRASYEVAKGTYTTICLRTYLFFDLSSINGTITAATLKVLGGGGGTISDDIQVVPSTAWGGDGTTTTIGTGDYDAVEFTDTLGSDYGALLSWSGTTYNDFTLTSNAISDMNANGYLNCALLNQDNDYRGVNITITGTDIYHIIEFNDPTNPIKLEITYTPAGWDLDANGVLNSAIVSINGVTEADIINVIGAS